MTASPHEAAAGREAHARFEPYSRLRACRVCGAGNLETVHDFGTVPLADKLISEASPGIETAPLSVSFCAACRLLQINENISPETLFRKDYPYHSSKVPEVAAHFKALGEKAASIFPLERDDVILEIAGNDGVLLRHFRNGSRRLVNVEPSIAPAAVSESLGIETIREFFSASLAARLAGRLPRPPRLIFASNVLAHVPDPADFVAGLAAVSGERTFTILEVPHLLPMIKNCAFDSIFHQHFSYFSLRSLLRLFGGAGLHLADVEEIGTQGGSLRLTVSKTPSSRPCAADVILRAEEEAGSHAAGALRRFSRRIREMKDETLAILDALKKKGASVAGYGAPGKAATMLNYFGITGGQLDYLVDISPTKHGKIFPFTGLVIHPVAMFDRCPPDCVWILAWNYADSITRSLAHLRDRGVRFMTHLPSVRLI